MTKTITTRIKNKFDTLANWSESNTELLRGELALVQVDTTSDPDIDGIINTPAVLVKVGDNDLNGNPKNFNNLPYISALAADVYAWGKLPSAEVIPFTITDGDTQTTDKTLKDLLELINERALNNAADIANIKTAVNRAEGELSIIVGNELNTATGYASATFGDNNKNAGNKTLITGTQNQVIEVEGEIAPNSNFESGQQNIISGYVMCSGIIGKKNMITSNGHNTFIGGISNTVENGGQNFIGGTSNIIKNGAYNTTLGSNNTTDGFNRTFVAGYRNIAGADNQTLLGRWAKGKVKSGSDILFAVGNGISSNYQYNVIESKKDGTFTIMGSTNYLLEDGTENKAYRFYKTIDVNPDGTLTVYATDDTNKSVDKVKLLPDGRIKAFGAPQEAEDVIRKAELDHFSLTNGERDYSIISKDSENSNIAQGTYNYLFGNHNTSTGKNNFISGTYNTADGFEKVTIFGFRNTAAANEQTLLGKWASVKADTHFAVGNGRGGSTKYNVLESKKDGTFIVKASTDEAKTFKDAFKVLNDGRAKVFSAPTEENDVVRLTDLSAENVYFDTDIYTSCSVGNIAASPDDRKILFKKGENLLNAFNNIFDETLQPTITQPKLTLNLNKYNVQGELGAPIPEIIPSVSRSNGSYSFGPKDTGVAWVGQEVITSSGNTSGKIGDGNITYTATQSYTAAGVIALDNKGNFSNPEQKITGGSSSDTKTVVETIQYRYFYGNVSGDTVETILNNLKAVKVSIDSLKTSLSKQTTITITLSANGYIYFVSKDAIKRASSGGFGVPLTSMGIATFTNSYNKTYAVNVYRTASEQTPNTYTIDLEY